MIKILPTQRTSLQRHSSGFRTAAVAAMLTVFPVVLAGCVGSLPAHADTDLEVANRGDVSVQAEGVFGGKSVNYTASFERFEVPGTNGLPDVSLATFSYVAEPDAKGPQRPVLFAFNGGPISPSFWLHIGALGPQRVSAPVDLSAPASEFELIENTTSPLDVADLVFFDPASTGFSRVAEGEDPRAYYSVEADAAQFVNFVQAWLKRHGRQDAPVFILGESYGTMRAAEAAGQMTEAGQPPAGVYLMGQALNIIEYSQRRQNILSYVASLPTLAALAWETDMVDRSGRDFDAFMSDVNAFGQTEYLLALYQGSGLDRSEQAKIADKLEGFTGIPADWYLKNHLRISKEQFRVELLRDSGKVLGRSDGRYLGEDPRGDASSVLKGAYTAGWSEYLSETFGIHVDEQYALFAELNGLDDWRWGASSPFGHFDYSARLDRAFTDNPDFRLAIGNGYHDTMTTVGAADLLAKQAGWPADRVRLLFYQGGHMAYSIDETAVAFNDDIRDWITGRGDWTSAASN